MSSSSSSSTPPIARKGIIVVEFDEWFNRTSENVYLVYEKEKTEFFSFVSQAYAEYYKNVIAPAREEALNLIRNKKKRHRDGNERYLVDPTSVIGRINFSLTSGVAIPDCGRNILVDDVLAMRKKVLNRSDDGPFEVIPLGLVLQIKKEFESSAHARSTLEDEFELDREDKMESESGDKKEEGECSEADNDEKVNDTPDESSFKRTR